MGFYLEIPTFFLIFALVIKTITIMKNVNIKFVNDYGTKVTLKAVMTDDLSALTKSKKNELVEYTEDKDCGLWFLYFYTKDQYGYDYEVRGELEEDEDGNTKKVFYQANNSVVSYIAEYHEDRDVWHDVTKFKANI